MNTHRVPLYVLGETARTNNGGILVPLAPGSLHMFTKLTAWIGQALSKVYRESAWVAKLRLGASTGNILDTFCP